MSAVKALIDAGIAGQSVALLGENLRVTNKSIKARSGANTKSLIKLGLTNVVGINLLRSQAQLAEGL